LAATSESVVREFLSSGRSGRSLGFHPEHAGTGGSL
jgi:hypothetical protein